MFDNSKVNSKTAPYLVVPGSAVAGTIDYVAETEQHGSQQKTLGISNLPSLTTLDAKLRAD